MLLLQKLRKDQMETILSCSFYIVYILEASSTRLDNLLFIELFQPTKEEDIIK